MRQAILLVCAGTTVELACVAYSQIEKQVAARFPAFDIAWAYASQLIRERLEERGEHIADPEVALKQLHEDGYSRVVVHSLHVAAGSDFHELASCVARMRIVSNMSISLGMPLLVSSPDLKRVVFALLQSLPDVTADDAIVLMGHGAPSGRTDMVYLAAAAAFKQVNPRAVLGTIAGSPTFEDVLLQLDAMAPKQIHLVPFMTVAGRHARRDLVGAFPQSWQTRLEQDGRLCVAHLRGLGEYCGVVEVWLDHLQDALNASS
jgi:sirohydrochlorin cobaltochelatase